jgi:hypothetical protein
LLPSLLPRRRRRLGHLLLLLLLLLRGRRQLLRGWVLLLPLHWGCLPGSFLRMLLMLLLSALMCPCRP